MKTATLFYFVSFLCLSNTLFAQFSGLQISKTVSTPSGNSNVLTGHAFEYRIDYSINNPNLTNIKIEDFVPLDLDILSTSYNTVNWSQTIVNNQVTLTYIGAPITSLGGFFTIKVKFKKGEVCDGIEVCNIALISGDSTPDDFIETSNLVCVTAQAQDRWQFSKTHDTGNAIDNDVVFDLNVINPSTNDLGGYTISNTKIVDVFPTGATVTAILDRFGNNITNASNVSYSGNMVTIDIGILMPQNGYKNFKHQIYLRCPSPTFAPGQVITNSATLMYDLPCGNMNSITDQASVTLTAPIASGSIVKFVNENSPYTDDLVPGCKGRYEIQVLNTGNAAWNNFNITDFLPVHMPIKIDQIFILKPPMTDVITMNYTDLSGVTGTVPLSGGGGPGFSFDSYSPPAFPMNASGQQTIGEIEWIVDKLNVGQLLRIFIDFTILSTDLAGTTVNLSYPTISNCVDVDIPGGSVLSSCANFNIEPYEVGIRGRKSFSNNSYNISTASPGDIIRYRLRVQNFGPETGQNLVVKDILDNRLEYCGNETYAYGASTNPGTLSPSVPSQVGVLTTNHTSPQNLEWNVQSMPGNCLQGRFFYIEFDVMVKNTASTSSGNHIPNHFTITGDNFSNQTSNFIFFSLYDFAETSPEKYLRALGGFGFTQNLTVNPGATIEYALNITNGGNVGLQDIVAVEMLPFAGDTWILNSAVTRCSVFPTQLTGPITPPSSFTGTILYSTDASPDFINDISNSGPGTTIPTWVTAATIGTNWTSVRNIKVVFPSTFILQPGATEQFLFPAVVPVGVPPGSQACNSFAFISTDVNDNLALFPVENPVKACVTLSDNPGCCIGDFVWQDLNNNGIQDAGEPGVNNVTIHLIAPNGNILATTVSANDYLGNAGYYQFCNLEDSDYRLEVILGAGQFITPINIGGDNTIDSDIDPLTQQSQTFTIINSDPNCTRDDLDIGLSNQMPPLEGSCTNTCVSACYNLGPNMLLNGSFQLGNNIGFQSNLDQANPNPCDVGAYLIGVEARDLCINFAVDIFDHTYGNSSGLYMVIDGNDQQVVDVWYTNVSLIQGKDYHFSFHTQKFNASDSPQFDILVDGVVIGTLDGSATQNQVWNQHCFQFTASTSASVPIVIRQTTFGFIGFDYGIDDLCLSELSKKMQVQMPVAETTICSDASYDLLPIVTGANGSVTCSWTSIPPGSFSSNSCSPTFSPSSPGTYDLQLTVQDQEGCTATTQIQVIAINCNFTCACDTNCTQPGPNLIQNGHFEQGPVGFTSDLTPAGPGIFCVTGLYRLDFEASQLCNAFTSGIYDHTFANPNGTFMIIDGDENIQPRVVYRTTVNVNPGKSYNFSFFSRLVSSSTSFFSPDLEMVVDNQVIDFIDLMNTPIDFWIDHCATWYSGNTSGPVTLEIRQVNRGQIGYEYGLDDFCFAEQMNDIIIDMPSTITVCDSASIEIPIEVTGGNSGTSCSWMPLTDLNNPNSCTPTFIANGPGTYTYTVTVTDGFGCSKEQTITIQVISCNLNCPCFSTCTRGGVNLVANGNFEQGDVGFSSNLNSVGVNACVIPGFNGNAYRVDHMARDLCINFPLNFFDNDLGTPFGHYMIIDGNASAATNVYMNTVNIIPNRAYDFSFWTLGFGTGTNPSFDLIVNGQVIGSVASNQTVTGQWVRHCFGWSPGNISGPVQIMIRQTNFGFGGYDYGIDDVCFSQTRPTIAASAPDDFSVCNYGQYSLTPITPIGATCSWTSSSIFAMTLLTGANTCNPTFTPSAPGTFTYTMTVSRGLCSYSEDVTITVLDCEPDCTCGEEICTGAGPNLVKNGGFESGNVGFTTGTGLPYDCECNSGSYCVDLNARDKCTVSAWDPVLGSGGVGKYMIVDGALGKIWEQGNIAVVGGKNYRFSFDLYPDISGDPSPTLAFYVNGNLVQGNIMGNNSGQWNAICIPYTATATGTLTLEVRETADNGYNDYGLDNFCFHELIPMEIELDDQTVCAQNSYILSPVVTGGTGNYSCTWSPSQHLTSTSDCYPGFSPPGPGTYTYTLTVDDENMCQVTKDVTITVINCDCDCDRDFYLNVHAGFKMITGFNACRTRIFTAKEVDSSCDAVDWEVIDQGTIIGTATGTNFSYNFPSDGGYKICMNVERIDGNGMKCRASTCQKIQISCSPPYVDLSGTVLMNGGFTVGTGGGDLDQTTTLEGWSAAYGAPKVVNEPGCDDDRFVKLYGNATSGHGLSQEVSLVSDKRYVLSFCYRYRSSVFGDLPPGTRLVMRLSTTPQTGQSCTGECEVAIKVPLNPDGEDWESVAQDPMLTKYMFNSLKATFSIENDLVKGVKSYIDLDNISLRLLDEECDANFLNIGNTNEIGIIYDSDPPRLVGIPSFQTSNKIHAAVVVDELANVHIKAENEATLQPGMEVLLGGELTVEAATCTTPPMPPIQGGEPDKTIRVATVGQFQYDRQTKSFLLDCLETDTWTLALLDLDQKPVTILLEKQMVKVGLHQVDVGKLGLKPGSYEARLSQSNGLEQSLFFVYE